MQWAPPWYFYLLSALLLVLSAQRRRVERDPNVVIRTFPQLNFVTFVIQSWTVQVYTALSQGTHLVSPTTGLLLLISVILLGQQ